MNKRIVLSLVLMFGLVGLSVCVCAAPQPAVFCKYKQQLSAELAALEDEICSTFSITHVGWSLYKKSWKWSIHYSLDRSVAADQLAGKTLSPRFAAIVKNLFKRLGVSGKVYNAKDYVDPNASDAATKDRNLYYGTSDGSSAYIDEETMTRYQLSDHEIEATILHELVHNVMEYNLTAFALQKLIEKNTGHAIIKIQGQVVLRKLRHLHEKIADIFGGLAGGMGAVQGFISEYSRGYSPASEDHPASSMRVAYMRAVLQDMQADPYYSAGNGYGQALGQKL